MNLQVVYNFNLVNSEATSFSRAQMSQEWNYKLITISNNQKWSHKLFLASNESGMKLQVVSNFNLQIMKLQVVSGLQRVKNGTTSWF